MLEVIHHHFKEIGSTNTWAKEQAESFPRDKMVLVTADAQSAGRGRFKREWVSPSGQNVYATFCCFVSRERGDIGHIPQILALAAAEAIENVEVSPKLKWPNDVIVNGKKIAGILCETVMVDDLLCVVTGIGLNVNMPIESLEAIDRPATSLLTETGKTFSVEMVCTDLQHTFVPMLTTFLKKGFGSFLDLYRKKQGMEQGEPVQFHDNLRVWDGFFHSINDDGSLTLTLKDGTQKIFLAGEFI